MCKKRIIVLSICGIMATSLVGAFLLPVRARSMGISFPLLHHHSEACLGKVVRRQESDSPGSLNKTYEDICPNCGGALHGYVYRCTCSCGETWYSEGYACYNSPYGSNPEGGCSNYSPVNFNTMHNHECMDYVCGNTEETEMGMVDIDISTTDPAREVTLTATYHGELAKPEFSWQEEPEDTEEEGQDALGEEFEEPSDGTKEPEDPQEESEEDKEEADKESGPEKLGSSITVVKNGVFTLTTEYEEDGIGYSLSKSVTIGNIDRTGPEITSVTFSTETQTTEPVILTVEAEDENGLHEQAYSLNGTDFMEEDFFTVNENGEYTVYVRDSLGNISEKTVSVSNIIKPAPPSVPSPEPESEEEVVPATPEEEVKPAEEHPTKVSPAVMVKEPEEEKPPKVEEKPLEEERKEEIKPVTAEPTEPVLPKKKSLLQWYADLPAPVKIVTTISASTLAGAVMLFYAWLMLFRTARVMWVDEDGRKHFLSNAFIQRKTQGFAIRLTKRALLKAECDDFCILLPGLFVAIYRYQPVALFLEKHMYSLHVERKIQIHEAG